MMRFLLVVFLTLLAATVFGVGGSLLAGAADVALILFYVFLGLILLCLMLGPSLIKRR